MFENPFSFEGRIRRAEYVISSIILVPFTYGVAVSIGLLGLPISNAVLLFIFVSFPLLWFLLAQGFKRSQDIGNSGWWVFVHLSVAILLAYLIIGNIIGDSEWWAWLWSFSPFGIPKGLIGNGGWWTFVPLFHLWLLFKGGQSGINQYGEDPKRFPW